MIKTILDKALKQNALIGIRTEMIEYDETIIGFIRELNTNFVLLQEIDEYGAEIGNTSINIGDIIHVDLDDRYQKRLLCVYQNKALFDKNKKVAVWDTGKLLLKHINQVIENKTLVTFYFDEDNFVTGFALQHNSDYIEVMNIGEEGDEDGLSYYPIGRITGLTYNGLKEQKIKLLLDNKELFS